MGPIKSIFIALMLAVAFAAHAAPTVTPASILTYGAKCNGVADDTAAIQKAVTAALTVTIPDATCMVSDTITVPSNRTIRGNGAGSVLKKTSASVNYIFRNSDTVSGNSDITIESLTLDGSRGSDTVRVTSKDALYLTKCTRCAVRGVTVRSMKNDGIIIEYGSGSVVENNFVTDCNKAGIYFSGAESVTATGNVSVANGIALQVSATWYGSFSGNTLNASTQVDLIIGRDSRHNTISANTIGPPVASQWAVYGAAESIGAGTLHGIVYPGDTILWGNSFTVFVGNRVRGYTQFFNTNDSVIAGNTFSDSANHGIQLQGSSRNTISGNYITSWTAGLSGIALAAWTALDTPAAPVAMAPPIQSDTNNVYNNYIYDAGGASPTLTDTGTNTVTFGNKLIGSAATTDVYYKVGSWTPVLAGAGTAGTQTYAVQQGTYVKIGRLVYVQGAITLSALDAATAGALRITGLPFVAQIAPAAVNVPEWSNVTLTAGYSAVGGDIPVGFSFIQLTQSGSAQPLAGLTKANFANNSALVFSAVFTLTTP